jgi:hypothetical protein
LVWGKIRKFTKGIKKLKRETLKKKGGLNKYDLEKSVDI